MRPAIALDARASRPDRAADPTRYAEVVRPAARAAATRAASAAGSGLRATAAAPGERRRIALLQRVERIETRLIMSTLWRRKPYHARRAVAAEPKHPARGTETGAGPHTGLE